MAESIKSRRRFWNLLTAASAVLLLAFGLGLYPKWDAIVVHWICFRLDHCHGDQDAANLQRSLEDGEDWAFRLQEALRTVSEGGTDGRDKWLLWPAFGYIDGRLGRAPEPLRKWREALLGQWQQHPTMGRAVVRNLRLLPAPDNSMEHVCCDNLADFHLIYIVQNGPGLEAAWPKELEKMTDGVGFVALPARRRLLHHTLSLAICLWVASREDVVGELQPETWPQCYAEFRNWWDENRARRLVFDEEKQQFWRVENVTFAKDEESTQQRPLIPKLTEFR